MQHEKQNPVALAGGHRADVKCFAAISDRSEPNAECLFFQAAYVAARYRLSPCMARLICELANIGGRLA